MKISHLANSAAALTALALSCPAAHALDKVAASCATSDGKYEITIADLEGIGPKRASRLKATITFADGTLVATYPVEVSRSASMSFGRWQYEDLASGGKLFLLAGPATNEAGFSLRAETDDAEINDRNLKCSIFLGDVLGK